MSVVAAQVVEWFDPLRDSRHRSAKAAREQADWLNWLEVGGRSPRTLEEYERNTAVLLRMFPEKRFREFTDGDILAALATFPARSRSTRADGYRSWFKWGYKTRRLKANPTELLPEMRRFPQRVVEVFSEVEEAALRALPCPHGNLMTILFCGGLRKAEARNLRAKRLNWATHPPQLIVKEGAKGSKERVLAMVPELAAAADDLVRLEGIGDDEYLWGSRPGGARRVRRDKPIGDSSFLRWWRDQLAAASVEYRKPHATRHTFATRWRERGLPLADIQLLLGHASPDITARIYVHTEAVQVGARMMELIG